MLGLTQAIIVPAPLFTKSIMQLTLEHTGIGDNLSKMVSVQDIIQTKCSGYDTGLVCCGKWRWHAFLAIWDEWFMGGFRFRNGLYHLLFTDAGNEKRWLACPVRIVNSIIFLPFAMKRLGLFILIMTISTALYLQEVKYSFALGNSAFLLHSKPFRAISGAWQYPRVPKESRQLADYWGLQLKF